MPNPYAQKDWERNREHPLIALRLPSPEVREQVRAAAVAGSTSVSGWVRSLILEALEEENTKQTA